MILRATSRWLLALMMLAGLAHAPTARAEFAVVSIRSIDQALADVKYVMKMAGKENEFAQVEGIVNSVLPTSGVDTKRPLGVMITKPTNDKPPALLFLPIHSEADLLERLRGFNLEITDLKDGLHSLDTPFGIKLYMKSAHKYLFVTDQQALLKGELPDPLKTLSDAHLNNLFALSVRFDQVPESEKKKLLDEVDRGITREKERKSGESDSEHKGRLVGMQLVRDMIAELLSDGKELGFSMKLDHEKHRLIGDLYMTAKPGSTLAGRIDRFGQARSMFSCLCQSAAISMIMKLPIDDQIRKQFNDLIDTAYQEAMKQEENVVKKVLAEKIFKTLEPTLKSDVVDAAVVAYGPSEEGHLTGLAALRVRDGKKMEELARDLLRNMPEKDKSRFQQDVAKVDNVAIHCIRPPQGDPQAMAMFGSVDIYFAFRDDVFLVAIGKNGQNQMEYALRSLASAGTAKVGNPVQLELHLTQLIGLEKNEEKRSKAKQLASEIFKDKQLDDVNFSLQGGDAFRVHLDASTHILRFLVRLNEAGH